MNDMILLFLVLSYAASMLLGLGLYRARQKAYREAAMYRAARERMELKAYYKASSRNYGR